MGEGGEQPLDVIARRSRMGGVFVQQIDECGHSVSSMTWEDLFRTCERGVGDLSRRFRPGATVCAIVRQDAESIATVLSCIAAGLRVVCVHPQAPEAEVRWSAEQAGVEGIAELLGNSGPPEARDAGSVILSSSGTTGGPRMAVRDWSSLVANGNAAASGLALRATDRLLVGVPLCHSYGVDLLCACLASGACMILLERAAPRSIAAGLARGATVWPTVPFQLEQAFHAGVSRHSLRTIVSAGSWLPGGLWQQARDRWGVTIGQLYGATEVGTVSVRRGEPTDDVEAVGLIGRGVGDASLVVVDRDNPARVCEDGEEGELIVRASSMASCYVDGPLWMADGFWRSGDVARRLRNGEIEVTGRWKLLIDVGGFKVNPIEVERVIASCPGVASCLVVGVRASPTVERLRALYVLADGAPPLSDDALRSYVRKRLSAAKVPRSFERVNTLPRSASGKVLRGNVH